MSCLKSEKSPTGNHTLGSLIFETPPKGSESRTFECMSLNQLFLDERVVISPTPFK